MRRAALSTLSCGILAILIAGCAEVGSTRPEATDRRLSREMAAVAVGTKPEELKAKFGEPTEIRSYPVPNHKAEVWIYRYLVGQKTNYVASSMHSSTMYSDPLKGGNFHPGETQVLTPEHISVEETTAFVLLDGTVEAIRQIRVEHREYE